MFISEQHSHSAECLVDVEYGRYCRVTGKYVFQTGRWVRWAKRFSVRRAMRNALIIAAIISAIATGTELTSLDRLSQSGSPLAKYVDLPAELIGTFVVSFTTWGIVCLAVAFIVTGLAVTIRRVRR